MGIEIKYNTNYLRKIRNQVTDMRGSIVRLGMHKRYNRKTLFNFSKICHLRDRKLCYCINLRFNDLAESYLALRCALVFKYVTTVLSKKI